MNNKQQFILALVFTIAFCLISGFIFIYGAINDITLWETYKPYFNIFLTPIGAIIGYYSRMYIAGETKVTKEN